MTVPQQLLESEDHSTADFIRQTIEVKHALDGVATVRIEIGGLKARGAVELVRLLTPHCRAIADEHVRNTGFSVARQPGDPVRYLLAEPEVLDHVEWTYTISNAVQLRRSDLEFCNIKAPWRSTLGPSETWNPYRVQLRCQTFIQSIVLPQEIQVAFKRPHGSEGNNGSQRSIVKPGDLVRDAGANCATMTVRNPTPGACYGIVYEPSESKGNFAETTDVGADIVRACLTQHASKRCASAQLAERVHRHLSRTLVSKPSSLEGVSWTVLLWSKRHRRLVPVCCMGPVETWSARFAYGNGIAGHSFRFGLPAGYVAEQEGTPSLIHQKGEEVEGVQLTEYGWIVALPLKRRRPEEYPVGVLTLSGIKHTDALVELAKLLTNANTSDPGRLLANALHVANCSFWSALVEVPEVLKSLHRHEPYLRDALGSYQSAPAQQGTRSTISEPISPRPPSFDDLEVELGPSWFKTKVKGRWALVLAVVAAVALSSLALYVLMRNPGWYLQLVQDQKALSPDPPAR